MSWTPVVIDKDTGEIRSWAFRAGPVYATLRPHMTRHRRWELVHLYAAEHTYLDAENLEDAQQKAEKILLSLFRALAAAVLAECPRAQEIKRVSRSR